MAKTYSFYASLSRTELQRLRKKTKNWKFSKTYNITGRTLSLELSESHIAGCPVLEITAKEVRLKDIK